MTTPLNPHQLAAVTCGAPRVLVRASAGSGKTEVVGSRIARLMRGNWHPAEILALTFTRKAAAEMRARVEARLEGERIRGIHALTVSTFHSWAARLLRQYADRVGLAREFTVRDETDKKDLILFAGREVGVCPLDGQKPKAGQWRSPDRLWQEEAVRARYFALLREARALDFDGLETSLIRLLSLEDVAAELRRRWRHVLVDEFQDTSGTQQEILDLLRPDHLFVVGDSSQSIYRFRGARVEGFTALADDPAWTVLTLPTNYRSLPPIVEAANRLAAGMVVLGIEMDAGREDDGEAVVVTVMDGASDVLVGVASETGGDAGSDFYGGWRDCAVLAPTWRHLEDLAAVLEARGIPHRLARHVADVWDTEEARWAVACLRVAVNLRDHLALWSALTAFTPRVTLGRWAGFRAQSVREERSILDVVASALPRTAGPLHAIYGALGRQSAHATLTGIVADLVAELHALHLESRAAALTAFLAAVDAQPEAHDPDGLVAWLDGYAGRHVEGDVAEDDDEDAVTLATIHGAKGLEWPAVWLLGWHEGDLPRVREEGPSMEEASRLAYVALTRARDRLRIVVDGSRTASRFLPRALPGALEEATRVAAEEVGQEDIRF